MTVEIAGQRQHVEQPHDIIDGGGKRVNHSTPNHSSPREAVGVLNIPRSSSALEEVHTMQG
ncbi:MAG: hypothetical protein KatS3mg113_0426 [Planctomycetaceae bacterium]|nr:MAG: hypothetical protein KatS3mg113_0426 [Planctomycetaceae bacterium]